MIIGGKLLGKRYVSQFDMKDKHENESIYSEIE